MSLVPLVLCEVSVFFVGVDVQVRRRCPFAVMDEMGHMIESGWLPGSPTTEARHAGPSAADTLRELVDRYAREGAVWAGIDAPRTPLPRPRSVGFRSGTWGPIKGRGLGRHCEVVVRSLGLANPQWTPLAQEAPEWMRLGFDLFAAASDICHTVEVFPSATYRALQGSASENVSTRVEIDLATLAMGPKDMLDAVACAGTVRALATGKGCEIGGGDGLGTIALPRQLTADEAGSPVHQWPETNDARPAHVS